MQIIFSYYTAVKKKKDCLKCPGYQVLSIAEKVYLLFNYNFVESSLSYSDNMLALLKPYIRISNCGVIYFYTSLLDESYSLTCAFSKTCFFHYLRKPINFFG